MGSTAAGARGGGGAGNQLLNYLNPTVVLLVRLPGKSPKVVCSYHTTNKSEVEVDRNTFQRLSNVVFQTA